MTFFCERLGKQGPHVIILHGWGRSGADYKPLAEMMSLSHQVHLLDLPGFGKSPHPGADWSAQDYAKALHGYITEHCIEKAQLIGHSFGGKIGLALTASYPEKVDKLVLISAAGLKNHHPWPKRLRSRWISFLGKMIKRWDRLRGTAFFASWFTPRYGSANYRDAGQMKNILVKSVNEDYSALLSTIKTPALLLWGEWDTETLPEAGKRMAALIPNSRLILFPQKDHYFCCGVGGHLVGRYVKPFLMETSQ